MKLILKLMYGMSIYSRRKYGAFITTLFILSHVQQPLKNLVGTRKTLMEYYRVLNLIRWNNE